MPLWHIRRMVAEDVPKVVAIHLAAFPEFFLSALGPQFLRTYYSSGLADPTSVCLVAVTQSELVGFIVGSTNPGGLYRRLLRSRGFRFAVSAIPAVVRRPAVVPRVMRALRKPASAEREPGTAGVFSFATTPSAQGQGIGEALLRQLLRLLAEQGSQNAVLETDADDNEGVRRLYERLGFAVLREYLTEDDRPMVEYVFRDLQQLIGER